MESEQIIAAFRTATTVPAEAVRAAERRRGEMIPILIQTLERAAKASLDELAGDEAVIFLAFHLLGSWKVRPAYRVLARLLSADSEKVEGMLGDATTSTVQRVMINVFDGDTAPLKAIVEDPDVDCHVRRRMLDTMGMLVVAGRLPRDETAAYLRDLGKSLKGDPDSMVWSGWAELIAQLGLRELRPLVEHAYCAGRIDPALLSREDFDRIMQEAEAGQPMSGIGEEFQPLGDVVTEFEGWTIQDDWAAIEEEEIADITEALRETGALREIQPRVLELAAGGGIPEGVMVSHHETFQNPIRYVGRNDPCPCGSGKKFKRCCGQWK